MKLITKFEDEAFKLNETVNVDIATIPDGRIKAQAVAQSGGVHTFFYDDLKTFANDWEDYEEPKEYWYISEQSAIVKMLNNPKDIPNFVEGCLSIGNLFETKEEAEKVVEKLKAWKRLKDKGFKFTAWKNGILLDETVAGQVRYEFPIDNKDDIEKDLDLLFGGEE